MASANHDGANGNKQIFVTVNGTRFTGLETPAMMSVGCSLAIQPSARFGATPVVLDPCRVVVPQDGGAPRNVAFQGCTVLQLHPTGRRDADAGVVMPPILTIAGPCRYTSQDRRDFDIMMRSRAQAAEMRLPPNGEMDWPDRRAFETCPCCGRRATTVEEETAGLASSSNMAGAGAAASLEGHYESFPQYWMVFFPLIQAADEGMGMRTIARLVCPGCFEDLTEGIYMRAAMEVDGGGGGGVAPTIEVQDVPLLDIVEDVGSVTFLKRGMGMGKHSSSDILPAYTLYLSWEMTGAWQALCNDFADTFQGAAGGKVEIRPTRFDGYRGKKHRAGIDGDDEGEDDDDDSQWVLQNQQPRVGEKCGGPGCDKVHGSKRVRLRQCRGCKQVLYCGIDCQSKAWPDHKAACQARQDEIKAEAASKKAKEKAEREAKMEEALASFVPLSITPQGPGGGKKGKKKGGGKGKKKKGKK